LHRDSRIPLQLISHSPVLDSWVDALSTGCAVAGCRRRERRAAKRARERRRPMRVHRCKARLHALCRSPQQWRVRASTTDTQRLAHARGPPALAGANLRESTLLKLTVSVLQYGPLFVETQIDGAKGGKVGATRMGRTYEFVVCSSPSTIPAASHLPEAAGVS
jgi:hypothetical protein